MRFRDGAVSLIGGGLLLLWFVIETVGIPPYFGWPIEVLTIVSATLIGLSFILVGYGLWQNV
jgi:hypothetical protein